MPDKVKKSGVDVFEVVQSLEATLWRGSRKHIRIDVLKNSAKKPTFGVVAYLLCIIPFPQQFDPHLIFNRAGIWATLTDFPDCESSSHTQTVAMAIEELEKLSDQRKSALDMEEKISKTKKQASKQSLTNKETGERLAKKLRNSVKS